MNWLKSHRWGVIALAVLIPASLLAAMSISWFRYTDSRSQHPVTVASGETGTYLADRPSPDDLLPGQTPTPDPTPQASIDPADLTAEISLSSYSIVGWDTDTGRDVGLLEGTEAVSAIIHVDARGLPLDTFGCDASLLAPGPEGDREWPAGFTDLNYFPGGDLKSSCDLESGDEFDWEAVFVVPEGVGDTARLVITDGALIPKQQLVLEH
jgi:hypothetical protein